MKPAYYFYYTTVKVKNVCDAKEDLSIQNATIFSSSLVQVLQQSEADWRIILMFLI